ncbi:ARM REPEAT PROTEIN INTERACTING WITH ABF2 [Camellia lanceoleosa]|uniref:ARM REPEAT PROTEIN INTERACTING WITH ABF2 n=1 Tax=Camellia lanceoleosa TaxID=1840588 RepID=A0ACC0GGG2_9ERIC|nr:ARM REPEAT PROTEIN INTERACTING WITH ABF2 [Camellia lanceoleosa]
MLCFSLNVLASSFVDLVIEFDLKVTLLKGLRQELIGIDEQVLSHLLYLMRIAEKTVQRRVALALANLCFAEDQRTIFIDNNGMPFSRLTFDIIEAVVPIDFICLYHLCAGLELRLGLLGSMNLKQQLDGLANKATTLFPIDAAPLSLTPQAPLLLIHTAG